MPRVWNMFRKDRPPKHTRTDTIKVHEEVA